MLFKRCNISSESDARGPGLRPLQKVACSKMLNDKDEEKSSSPRANVIGDYRDPLPARLRGTVEEHHAPSLAAYEPTSSTQEYSIYIEETGGLAFRALVRWHLPPGIRSGAVIDPTSMDDSSMGYRLLIQD